MMTWMVDPSIGITFGCGVSAHPKLMIVPEIVSPCNGVSIAPKGFVAVAFEQGIVFGGADLGRQQSGRRAPRLAGPVAGLEDEHGSASAGHLAGAGGADGASADHYNVLISSHLGRERIFLKRGP